MTKTADTLKPKLTQSSKVSADLRDAILRGDYAPGEKINLEKLRQQFDVSLSPMREAISRLMAEKLVLFEDQRGYRIAPFSAANLAEVTQLRADLESLALGYAIANAGLDWESAIPAALHRLNRAPGTFTSPDHTRAHERFHQALTSGCEMPVLLDFAAVLRNLHLRYRNVLGYAVTDRDVSAEHAAIAEAAIDRDRQLASALLRRHIERSGKGLAQLYAERESRAGAET